MTIPEFDQIQESETLISVLCLKCKSPINTKLPAWEMHILKQSVDAFVLVHCDQCDTTYSYVPASASLIVGEIPV